MAASTMGTVSSFVQSLENGRTSAFLPELPNIVAWLPTTTIFAWESSWVVAVPSSSVPTLAAVAQIAEIALLKSSFGVASDLLRVDDPDPQEACAGPQWPALD